MAASGVTDAHMARVVARARANAARNPYARENPPVTEDEVAASPLVADPLRELHVYPVTDWAFGMLLCCEERAAEFTDNPVWITGFGNCMDRYFVGDRDLVENRALKKAAERAYRMAGIRDPQKDFQMAEVYDGFAFQQLMWPEILGLIPEGKGPLLLERGALAIDGDMPINPSGGVVSTNAIGASALVRVAEAALQIMGKAEGGHQVPRKVHNALAHGWGGLFQFITITLLGDRPRHG